MGANPIAQNTATKTSTASSPAVVTRPKSIQPISLAGEDRSRRPRQSSPRRSPGYPRSPRGKRAEVPAQFGRPGAAERRRFGLEPGGKRRRTGGGAPGDEDAGHELVDLAAGEHDVPDHQSEEPGTSQGERRRQADQDAPGANRTLDGPYQL